MDAQRIRFSDAGEFHPELKRRVAEHFRRTGRSSRGDLRMHLKTALLLGWLVGSYVLLVWAATTWWQALLLSFSTGLAMAGIGMGIQHDANHGGYSSSEPVNRLLGLTLDLLGGSSYLWRWKHNVFHHTFTNVVGSDTDLSAEPFARMAPAQRRRQLHRYQHLYMWGLYGFLHAKWVLYDDWENLATGRIGAHRYPALPKRQLALFVAGKLVFLTWALVIPCLVHPAWAVAACVVAASFALSVVLAVTFQLAHCVGDAEFLVGGVDGRIDRPWAEHQLDTTVDFARGNRLVSWYLGGLNFQVEHHLFPKICHVHYPAISPIVEATCRDFGVPFRDQPTLRGALRSHFRWLRRLGLAAPAPAPDGPAPAGLPNGALG